MKKGFVMILSSAFLLGVTGCAANQTNNATNVGTGNDQTLITRVNYKQKGETETNNQNLKIQSRAAIHVEQLDEVEQARVIMRGNDAYVAVRLT